MGNLAKQVLLLAIAIGLIVALPLVALCSLTPSQGEGVRWSSEDWYRGAPEVDGEGNLYLLVEQNPEPAGRSVPLLRSLDSDGGLRWERSLTGILLPPAVDAEGDCYLVRSVRTANDSAQYGIGALSSIEAISSDGETMWTYDVAADFPGHSMVVPPVVPGDGALYLALASGSPSEDSYVAALGPQGDLLWRCAVPGTVTSILPPGGAGDRLLAASSGNLSFIDREGDLAKIVDLGVPSVQAGPAVLDDGTIVVGVDDGAGAPPEVWGVDAEGARRWNVTSVPPSDAAPDRAVKSILAHGSAAFVLLSGGTEVSYQPEGDAGTGAAETSSLPSVLMVLGGDGELRAVREVPGEATLVGWTEGAIAFSRNSILSFDERGEPMGSYPVPVGRWLNDLSLGPDDRMYLLQGGLWTGLVAVEGAPWAGKGGWWGEQALWVAGAAALGLLLAWALVRRR